MQSAKVQQLTAEERKDRARKQSAIFHTRLALARWMSGAEPLPPHSHPPLRATWLAKAQKDFEAWLDNGGFVQHDDSEAARLAHAGENARNWAA